MSGRTGEVKSHALLAVVQTEQIREGGKELSGVLSRASKQIRADGVELAHMDFRIDYAAWMHCRRGAV